MKTISFSRMDSFSGKTTKKLEMPSTIKFSFPSNLLMRFCKSCRENLESTPEQPKQKVHTEKKNLLEHGTVNHELAYLKWAMHQGTTDSSQSHGITPANRNDQITAPEHVMQIDPVPELPASGGYENIVTSMNVFYHYLFSYPTSKMQKQKRELC